MGEEQEVNEICFNILNAAEQIKCLSKSIKNLEGGEDQYSIFAQIIFEKSQFILENNDKLKNSFS